MKRLDFSMYFIEEFSKIRLSIRLYRGHSLKTGPRLGFWT